VPWTSRASLVYPLGGLHGISASLFYLLCSILYAVLSLCMLYLKWRFFYAVPDIFSVKDASYCCLAAVSSSPTYVTTSIVL
jgi:hypothetical protein